MNDLMPTVLVTLLGAMLVAACSVGLTRTERKWVSVSFAMHVAFACAQVPLVRGFFGGGDMFLYFNYGEILARMMERDPIRVIPEVTALLLHEQPRLPLLIIGAGGSTGSMSALTAWTFYLIGPSQYAASVALAMLSLCGKVMMYRVFRANVEPSFRFAMAIAALFVPSFVFWSSGLIKEAVVVAGFGWALFGLHLWIREDRPIAGWPLIAGGTLPMILIKPYILFPTVLAGGCWYYWARSLKTGRVRIRPLRLAVAALVAVGGIVLLSQYFPEYAFDNFTSRASDLQQLGHRGGSAFDLPGEAPSSVPGQFFYAPGALFTALFRPLIFEAHNLPALVNALETTVLTVLFAQVLLTRRFSRIRGDIAANPFMIFCVVFVVAFGIAVGLASSNLGTLSRYRCPLVPFFVVLLLVLRNPVRIQRRFPTAHQYTEEQKQMSVRPASRIKVST